MNAFLASSFQKIQNFQQTFWNSSAESLHKLFGALDDVLLALGIVLFGWLIGSWVKKGIIKLGEKLRLMHISEKIGLTHLLHKANIRTPASALLAEFIKGYIFTVFLTCAANLLGFRELSDFLDAVIRYIPNVLIALLIVLFGIKIADTTSAILGNTLKFAHSKAAAPLAPTEKYI